MAKKSQSAIGVVKGRRTRIAVWLETAEDSAAASVHDSAAGGLRFSTGPAAAADLRELFEFGAVYHQAHQKLRSAWPLAYNAIQAIAGSKERPEWRMHLSALLEAMSAMEEAAAIIERLVGVEAVAVRVRQALVALDELGVRSGQLDDLEAALRWLWSIDVERRHELVNVEVAPEDALLRAYLEATNPTAPGAIGCEAIRETIDDASRAAVAWHAWRAAGEGINWAAAWDTWLLLDRYTFDAIGDARGVKSRGSAVTKSRSQR